MKPKVLIVVEADPRTSGRPAEAIRVAAGIGTWKKAEVLLYLRGPAILSLAEYSDEWIDEDNFSRYLPILKEWGRPVYVQKGAPQTSELGEALTPFEEVSDAQWATIAAQSTYVFRF
jgi:sulfur relay (sulfurtransferase) DsrF/TusC family protein